MAENYDNTENISVKDFLQIDAELIENIKVLIEDHASESLIALIADLHPADIAEIIDHLNYEDAVYVFELLNTEQASIVITEIEENLREYLYENIAAKKIIEIVGELDTDDATDIVSELPEPLAEQVLQNIDVEDSLEVKKLLEYPEDSAGGIMNSDFVYISEGSTVRDAIEQVRKNAEEIDHIYHVYVLKENDELSGIVLLKHLLTNSLDTKIDDITIDDMFYVYAETDQEEVAGIMEKYDLVSIPVVDNQKRMLGRITIDDIVDVINEEVNEDMQFIAGLSEEEERTDSIFTISRIRLPWLIIALFGEMISAVVLSSFAVSIEKLVFASFFIPIVMAMGGSSGTQAAIVMVRGLESSDAWMSHSVRKLFKEFGVSFLNGLACAIILITATYFFFKTGLEFAIVLSIALLFIMILATLLGATIPIFFKRFGVDPAIATGPFVTTMNDVFGLLIYFSLITLFLVS